MGQHTYQNRKTSTLRRLCVRPFLSRCSVAGAESHRLAGAEDLIADVCSGHIQCQTIMSAVT